VAIGAAVKWVYVLVTLAAMVVLGVFVASNLDRVVVSLWPFATIETWLCVVVVAALLLGFLLGELVAWINGRHWRRKARQRARRIEALERELTATQAQLPRHDLLPSPRGGSAD
jgi:uncharacterized integral membrane protein